MTIRELIMELRKIANHDAMVCLCASGGVKDIEAIEVEEHGTGKIDIVYLRDYKENKETNPSLILSSTRRIVWQ
jgi:hypothetical protein